MEITTVIFPMVIIASLVILAITAIRLRVMAELDDVDESTSVAEASSYTIDGEQ